MSVEVGYCPVDRIEDLMAFIGSSWKANHVFSRDADLLRWQHRHRSDPTLLSILLAEDDGEPVGILGVIHADYCHLGERVPSGWLALWFTVEGARGAPGLALIRRAMNGDEAVLGTARFVEAPSRVYKGLGFHIIEEVPRWVAAVDSDALGRLLRACPSPFPDSFLGTAGGAASWPEAVTVDVWSPSVERAWDDVWRDDFAPSFMGVCRDAAFLRWRYLEHPRWKYGVRVARDTKSGRPRGIAVSRIESIPDRPESVFRILDLLFADEKSGTSLAQAMLAEARTCGAAFADFYCTRSGSAAPLEALGFVRESDLPRALPALFHPLDFRVHPINAAFWTHGRRDARERYSHPDLYMTRIEGDQDRPG
ncbi:MAG: hypothetical protein JRS35_16035 [Deltaproteobacteria bacterium]|nr:hypothetical protein [Deltaproteobacteria bacterium]